MNKTPLILSICSLVGVVAIAICTIAGHSGKKTAATTAEGGIEAGQIVYFNLDRVLEEYDMANDLRAVVETKVESINQEVNRKGSKLEKDIQAFQEKIDKGLLTRSVAEVQGQKLQEQQNAFQQYAAQKQQEIAEEQQVMLNNLADAIKQYIDVFNAERGYAMILSTQGGILPAPVVAADETLDITDELLEGLNAEYVKSKSKN